MDTLNEYRLEIDEIDSHILELFTERMALAEKIGEYKRANGLPTEDKLREAALIQKQAGNDRDKAALLREIMNISKAVQRRCYNIYIIGMPYSGKSTLLESIAPHTQRDCTDTDSMIEKKCSMSVSDIFQSHGEEYFRKVETEVLCELAKEGSCVVSTGGGILKSEENRRIIHASGYTVLCDTPPDVLCRAFEADMQRSRPLIRSSEDLEILYFERFKLYRENADLIINPQRKDALQSVLSFMEEKELI